MTDKARQYKPVTIRRLDTLSGNECAAPDCNKMLIARDGETIISKICHIEAANRKGSRYNLNMNDDERRHFNNLILLCDECHSIIDNKNNENKYPKHLLQEWKKNHESKLLYTLLSKKPTLLNQAINAISEIDFDNTSKHSIDETNVFKIDKKIEYNSILRNKTLITEYSVFYTKINSLYKELENQGSFKKEKLLRNIKQLYIKIKGNYIDRTTDELTLIQKNADNIIEDIEGKLLDLVDENQSIQEDIAFAIPIIMIDAFMRCKILEEPPKK